MTAVLSDDRKYRYLLKRSIPLEPGTGAAVTLGVIMINPSTADAELDDPTIRRLKSFASNYGCYQLWVGNLFALRSPDVSELGKADDPVGPLNAQYLRQLFQECGRVVVGWGSNSKIPKNHSSVIADLVAMAESAGVTLWCWGTNADGSPKHPLYLRSNTGLVPWDFTPNE